MRRFSRLAAVSGLSAFLALPPALVSGLALLSAGAVYLCMPQAAAQEAMQPEVGKPLQEAQSLAKAGNFSAALSKARAAETVSGKSEYESFVVNDFIGYLSARLGDHAAAVRAYEASLPSPHAAGDRARRLEMLAGMSYQAGAYGKAVQYAEQRLADFGENRDMRVLVMQSHYVAKDYPRAQAAAAALVESVEKAGGTPEESWLQIQMASAEQAKDANARHAALVKLVKYAPSEAYWRELLAQSGRAIGRSDKMALELARLMRAAGLMKEPARYMEAAQIAIQLGLPGEAESILREGFASGALGGENQNRERRLLRMAEELAREDKAGLADGSPATANAKAALANAYASYGEYEKAIPLYQAALAKGALSAPAETRLHLGQAQWASGDLAAARQTFASIGKVEKYGQLAEVWMLIGG